MRYKLFRNRNGELFILIAYYERCGAVLIQMDQKYTFLNVQQVF